ncbi:MAG TPA: hypothetical protein VGP82_01975 [Ktedonobacterales bacterium]|nr:hypothetical protein [Ktedonobacterales bacterium]
MTIDEDAPVDHALHDWNCDCPSSNRVCLIPATLPIEGVVLGVGQRPVGNGMLAI